jgi:transcriptional regulator with XRE-family HTH domain
MTQSDTGRKVAERLGEAVRSKRAALRLSQLEVAKAAGVSPTRVTEIENAKRDPRLSTVESVVAVLGLRITVEAA